MPVKSRLTTARRKNKEEKMGWKETGPSRIQHAVIYCRVSSHKQTVEGHGLVSQETRCREYAAMKKYEVVEVFRDDISGGISKRPGMEEMLTFLRKNRKNTHAVIIDDISRLARGLQAHIELRAGILMAGGILESPTVEFGEDSDSQLVENMLAAVSQHHRQKNSEQTVNRMRARLMNGFWPFRAPRGFCHERRRGMGKIMVPDVTEAPVITEFLEGFASGRFMTQAEATRFLNTHPIYSKKPRHASFKQDHIKAMLTNVIYAGYIEVQSWKVSLRKANHEALISYETFQEIQSRLHAGGYAPARPDLSRDFPLRGALVCEYCGVPLTGSWSRSKTGALYPYYRYRCHACPSKGKSVRTEVVEEDFLRALKSVQPDRRLFDIGRGLFKRAWDVRLEQAKRTTQELVRRRDRDEVQIGKLLEQVVECENAAVRRAYEKRIAELQQANLVLEEKIKAVGRPRKSFEEMFELSLGLLSTPCKLWENGNDETRRAVLRLVFDGPMKYCRKNGLRTPKTTLPFKVLEAISVVGGEMAAHRGIEPLFPG